MKIFRKIRRRLAAENNVAKYLRYAFGEIGLIVIGILIAMQINNWNEYRKDRIKEKKILHEIEQSLESDMNKQLNPIEKQLEQDLSNVNFIIKTIQNKTPYSDSLSLKFRSLMFSKAFKWEVTAYKNLENDGIDLISNEKLKREILTLYNMTYQELANYISNFSNNLTEFYRPQMRSAFRFDYPEKLNEPRYIPVNYQALLNDVTFMNSLVTARVNFQNILKQLKKTREDVSSLKKQISEELDHGGIKQNIK